MATRRRRECEVCGERWTTYEVRAVLLGLLKLVRQAETLHESLTEALSDLPLIDNAERLMSAEAGKIASRMQEAPE